MIVHLGYSQDEPPSIIATGNQFYCPGDQLRVVSDISITDPDNSGIDILDIQISQGYITGEDRLELLGTHPSIISTWITAEGKLSLTDSNGGNLDLSALENAIRDVAFNTTNPRPSGERSISFTLGRANYLPSTGHYYEYVQALGISWEDAEAAAASRTFYGLEGYLATVLTEDESQLVGSQASGAGWLGGSDREQEGVWKWVTGPETGTVFWNGGVNGSSPNFANWNYNEPNNINNEDYLHITAPHIGVRGAWNDLRPEGDSFGDYQPKGYIVEYGGMPNDPELNLASSTSIYMNGIDSVTEASRCGPGSVNLEATTLDGDILWFINDTDTQPVAQGPSFQTPYLSITTTFYAYASVNGCTGGVRVPVTASIQALPTAAPTVAFVNCPLRGLTSAVAP